MRGTFALGVRFFAAVVFGAALCGCRGVRDTDVDGSADLAPLPGAPSAPGTACAPPAAAPEPPACDDMPVVSRVLPEDVLRGHLNAGQGCAAFTFDGVEYTVMDVDLSTDTANAAAPRLTITDPDGRPLDLSPALGPDGSSCQRAQGIVLRKTGVYRGLVCKAPSDPDQFWTFKYALRMTPPDDERMHLVSCDTKTVAFTAAKGSRVIVTVTPEGRSGLVPRFTAVTDPKGQRALDEAKRLPGAPAPLVKDGRDGERVLDFNAHEGGRYTVAICAEPGTDGVAVTSVQVFPPKPFWRTLYHDNHPATDAYFVPTPCPGGGNACPAPGVAPTAAR